MRIIICGSREWADPIPIKYEIRRLKGRYGGALTIVHGAARGADALAGRAAELVGVKVEPHPADWDAHGKAAGPIRNQQMLDTGIDGVIAFHLGSRGTQDMIDRARRAGVPVIVYGLQGRIE